MIMTIDFTAFTNNSNKAFELYEKLNEPVFLKSQIDIVYTDYINWERNGILLTASDKEKGTKNKISRKDYLWCKLVQQLRLFNVSSNDILKLKSEWINTNQFKNVLQLLNSKKAIREEVKKQHDISNEQLQEVINTAEVPHIDAFDIFIITSIINGDELHLDFLYEDGDIMFFPRSYSAYKELSQEKLQSLSEIYSNHYVSISVSKLIKSITTKSINNEVQFVNEILTKEEHKLLFQIRRNTQAIKEIRIKYKQGEINLLEVDQWKKVQLESKVLNLIKSKDFKNIQLIIENGQLKAILETTKIKL